MNQLTITVATSMTDASVTIVRLQGHLDAETVKQLATYHTAEKAKGSLKWVVDMSTLDYISSAGLGFFMGILSEMRNKGGDVVFFGLSPRVLKIFNVLGVAQMFEIFGTEADAIKAFRF